MSTPLSTAVGLARLDPAATIEASFGSGRYQLRAALCLAGIYAFVGGFINSQVLILPKLCEDPRFPDFTKEAVSAVQTLIFVGWAVGNVVLSPILDNWGRSVPTYSLTLGMMLTWLTQAIAPYSGSLFVYSLALFMGGFCYPVGTFAYLFLQETMPSRLRASATSAMNICWTFGLAAMAVVSCLVTRHWDWQLELVLWASPLLILTVLGRLFTHESLHWLASKGKWQKANAVAAAIANTNGKDTLSVHDAEEPSPIEDSPSISNRERMRLLCSAPLRIRMIAASICWTAVTLSFYGLQFSAGSLSEDLYENTVFLAIADLVGYFSPALLIPRFGRRRTQAGCFLLAAVALCLCGVLPENSEAIVACAVVGRLLIDACFCTIYLLVVESFPTECRTTALGISNGIGRLASLGAPLAALLPSTVACPGFGVICLAAALATGFLPETSEGSL